MGTRRGRVVGLLTAVVAVEVRIFLVHALGVPGRGLLLSFYRGVDQVQALLHFRARGWGYRQVDAFWAETVLVGCVSDFDELPVGGGVAVRAVLHLGVDFFSVLVRVRTERLQKALLLGDDAVARLPGGLVAPIGALLLVEAEDRDEGGRSVVIRVELVRRRFWTVEFLLRRLMLLLRLEVGRGLIIRTLPLGYG